MTQKKITLTSAVLIGGKPAKAGTTVEVDRPVALDLIARNRAVEVVEAAPAAPAPEVEKTKEPKEAKK
jgi:ribosomal 50S subunit-recycling heat shock protein